MSKLHQARGVFGGERHVCFDGDRLFLNPAARVESTIRDVIGDKYQAMFAFADPAIEGAAAYKRTGAAKLQSD
jgi:hypothetical protein